MPTYLGSGTVMMFWSRTGASCIHEFRSAFSMPAMLCVTEHWGSHVRESNRWLEDCENERGRVLDADLRDLRQRHAALLGVRPGIDAQSLNKSCSRV